MANRIQSIELSRLVPHPDNPNRMSKAVLAKLVRNIKRTGRYEPLVVRPCQDKDCNPEQASGIEHRDCFQIINGHHRHKALKQLGYDTAEVLVWDIDDEQTDILLATLNRLGGSDILEKKLSLLRRLNKRIKSGELAKLLPQTAGQIERLANLEMPSRPAEPMASRFANPLVFFVNDKQQQVIEKALSLACCLCHSERSAAERRISQDDTGGTPSGHKKQTKAAKRAAALACIARYFFNSKEPNGEAFHNG